MGEKTSSQLEMLQFLTPEFILKDLATVRIQYSAINARLTF